MSEPRDDAPARPGPDVRPYGHEAPYGPPVHGAGHRPGEGASGPAPAGPPGADPGTAAGGSAPRQQGAYPPPHGAPGGHAPGYVPPPAAAPGPYPSPYAGTGYWPRNDLAVWSLVLALAGIVLACGFLTGIPAVIVGQNARRAVARGEANNDGVALAGIVLGWVAIALGVLMVALVVLSFLVPLVILGVTLPWANEMSGSGW